MSKKRFRVYFKPHPDDKRQYLKNSSCDVTEHPLEAKIFRLDEIVGKLPQISNDLGHAFEVDPGYGQLPIWRNLDAKKIPIRHEQIPKDELGMMKTGSWKSLQAQAKK
ncbi:hypothetical protein H7X65_02035 [Candidatus Parcubacteria bacterium]|nr:hypothetical protein [Candidatus Parcubacteria bacterium]